MKSNKSLVISNTAAQMIGKFVSMAVTILATTLIARTLGKAGYGQFTLIMQFSAFFYILADFGLNSVAAREIKSVQDRRDILKNLAVLRLGISLVLILIGFVALLFLPYNRLVSLGIILSLTTIITNSLTITLNLYFQMTFQYAKAMISTIISSTFLLIFILWVYFTSPPDALLMYVTGYVVAGLIMVLASLVLFGKEINFLRSSVSRARMRELLILSLPLGLMFIFSQIHGKADVFLLSVLKLPDTSSLNRNETLGVYGLAYKIFEVVLVFSTFFMSATYPILLTKSENLKELYRTYRMIVLFLALIGLLSMGGIYVFAPAVISLLGGFGFQDSILILRLLGLGLPIFFVSSATQWFILAIRRERTLPIIYAIGATITVLSNLILIPRYSYLSPAILTWMVEYLILLMMVGVVTKHYLSYVK